ncbi:hypothetical protein HMPREF1563_1388 [Providencia alcalifaciens 205/92]|uniref:Uncharacterized protein n=1 Tax=Providencia alcalifaciens 205/92 TaxID=1256988 RepID=A0AAV3M9B5_9GAMM|nr:hypothetical protein HMPREF1563_1388 [Providencia alcalifaciens 205/92]
MACEENVKQLLFLSVINDVNSLFLINFVLYQSIRDNCLMMVS